MIFPNPFINDAGRLRSGWRFLIFFALTLLSLPLVNLLLRALRSLVSATAFAALLEGRYAFILQGTLLLLLATLLGWLCGRLLEGLPLRALGWALHRNWWRDLAIGALVGAGSLFFAVLLIVFTGGYSFTFNATAPASSILSTLLFSFVVFLLGAAGEEALFRGYPLQTLMRSHPVLLAALPGSVLFAFGHLGNPNVAAGWTFINTALAGVWLAFAYWRTRSLWFPLGVHWAWNWTMASVLGTPVSGITSVAPQPLLRATETGADWFTGGAYGVEGGAACTLALLLSTLFIWRMKWLDATEDMRRWTAGENARGSKGVNLEGGDGAVVSG